MNPTSETNTPRTDSKLLSWNLTDRGLIEAVSGKRLGINGYDINGRVVDANFARTLETELAQANAELAALQADKRRLLAVARGCHDYSGGHNSPSAHDIYHHGIQTVINALEAFCKDSNDPQTLALERFSIAQQPDAAGRAE